MRPAEPELTIRRALPEDRQPILDLVSLCLGPGSVPRTPAFWDWKHARNPFGPSPILVAEADGRLVGLRAFLRWRWRSGEAEVPAVRAVDTATHPDWRGRGVFSRLTRRLLSEMAEEGAAFVFTTPNRASGAGYRKMGWSAVGRAPALVRPLKLRDAIRRWAGRGDSGPGREGPDLLRFPAASDLLAWPALDELLESPDAVAPDPRYRTRLDRRYLEWRYGAVPGLDYRALWRDEGGPPAAVIFRGRMRGRLREVVVAEVLAPPGEAGERAGRELLRRLAQTAAADHVVAVASPGTPERRALRRAGFVPLPLVGPRLVVRTLAPEPSPADPRRASSWRLSAGALEIF
ncbi:MAG TPA: GNAT family N-acetyltransferase [Thermoanaerobaculia bacterium]|nr:GNAT family N-acetyltransferase [Thermoanaerobaculia bacterium]